MPLALSQVVLLIRLKLNILKLKTPLMSHSIKQLSQPQHQQVTIKDINPQQLECQLEDKISRMKHLLWTKPTYHLSMIPTHHKQDTLEDMIPSVMNQERERTGEILPKVIQVFHINYQTQKMSVYQRLFISL